MTNNIKITVEYTEPKTDKFTELLKQYEQVKQTSQDTINYYKPLADCGEEKKMELILLQLETIKNYMIKIVELNKNSSFEISAYRQYDYKFTIKLNIVDNIPQFKIYWMGNLFSMDMYRQHKSSFNNYCQDRYNILGNWDKWEFYNELEKNCIKKLNELIYIEKEKAEKQVNRYKNITEG